MGERFAAWYRDRIARVGAPLWMLGMCLTLVVFGNRGQPSIVIGCLIAWSSMWLPYVAACRRSHEHGAPTLSARSILAWALLFRLVLVFAGLPTESPTTAWTGLRDDLGGEVAGYQPFLLWDNDVWRYLWDGHVTAAGISPYRTPPQAVLDASDLGEQWADDLVEEGPWFDVLDAMSYRDHASVYPPLALGLFRAAHAVSPGSVFTWKLLLVSFDWMGCVLFLLLLRAVRRPDGLVAWLAWNPLLLKEVAGSGHLEGALVPLLVAGLFALALGRGAWAAVALAAATLLKLWPLLLAPALLLRSRLHVWWIYGGLVALGLLPWRDDLGALLEALRSFGGSWVFNPGAWLLIERAALALGAGETAAALARGCHLGITALVCGWLGLRALRDKSDQPVLTAVSADWLWILMAYLLLAPTVMPWYLTVAIPVAAITLFWPWQVVTVASVLSYLIYALQREAPVVLFVEHTVIAIALLLWLRSNWRQAELSKEETHS